MHQVGEMSYPLPFTPDSSLANGLHVSAALGGGAPHAFLVDTGSVGVLVPRQILGPDYQDFDPSEDSTFGYISSGHSYQGQWVKVPVVLGVPADWDGAGDYPTAEVEVFAVDPLEGFNGGVLGIGFGIGGQADGGPPRNPLLHVKYQGARLSPGYILSAQSLTAGLTEADTQGFGLIALETDASGIDWLQPLGSYSLSGAVSPASSAGDLPILMDSGIDQMILWLTDPAARPSVAAGIPFPAGAVVTISAPPADQTADPLLQYTFTTGQAGQPMAPSFVEWRIGNGVNTGRNVLAGADYLYDAAEGAIGFRSPPAS